MPKLRPAKTIFDCFSYRNKTGPDIVFEGLRECPRTKRATPDQIWEFARTGRVWSVLRAYVRRWRLLAREPRSIGDSVCARVFGHAPAVKIDHQILFTRYALWRMRCRICLLKYRRKQLTVKISGLEDYLTMSLTATNSPNDCTGHPIPIRAMVCEGHRSRIPEALLQFKRNNGIRSRAGGFGPDVADLTFLSAMPSDGSRPERLMPLHGSTVSALISLHSISAKAHGTDPAPSAAAVLVPPLRKDLTIAMAGTGFL